MTITSDIDVKAVYRNAVEFFLNVHFSSSTIFLHSTNHHPFDSHSTSSMLFYRYF